MDARPFETIKDILRCLNLVQSLYKGRNAPIWRKREPTYMKLSGTDRLTPIIPEIVEVCSRPGRPYLIQNFFFNFFYNPVQVCLYKFFGHSASQLRSRSCLLVNYDADFWQGEKLDQLSKADPKATKLKQTLEAFDGIAHEQDRLK